MLGRMVTTFAAVVLVVGDAGAQERIGVGDRVRITTHDSRGRHIYTVAEVDGGRLTVTTERGSSQTIEAGSLKRLEVSGGRRTTGSGAIRGGGIGLLIGVPVGAVIGYAAGDDCGSGLLTPGAEPPKGACWGGRAGNAAYASALGGAAGGMLGLMFGAVRPGERWRRVQWLSSVSVAPRGGGVSVGLFTSSSSVMRFKRHPE